MPGEPEWFDVSKSRCIEMDEPGVEFPSNFIDRREDFYLQATFEGPHFVMEWHNMTDGEIQYTATFYGRAMGPATPADLDLGTASGKLKPHKLKYEVRGPTRRISGKGTWRCGVTVTFRLPSGRRYHGVIGHNQDCVIQISEFEEPH